MQKNKETTKLHAYAPLLWRVFAFLIAFVAVSGLLGSRVIGNELAGKYGFEVYGGAGKALLFSVVALLLLIYRNGAIPKLESWRYVYLLWLVAAASTLCLAWIAVGKLIVHVPGVGWPVAAHGGMLATIAFVALGVFGRENLRLLAATYRRELLVSVSLGIVFLGFLYLVYGLWQVMATVVLHIVSWLLSTSGLAVVVLPNHGLLLSKFAIQISKYCSGIDSVALFSGLYAVVGLVDWRLINQRRYFVAFTPALLLLFCCNILRVYLLIVAGYYVNPQIAFSLFHTYAGMVFFIIYSGIFWIVGYKWMLKV